MSKIIEMTIEARIDWDEDSGRWIVTQVDEVQLVVDELIRFPDEYGWVREEDE